jgi:hypothetical protein
MRQTAIDHVQTISAGPRSRAHRSSRRGTSQNHCRLRNLRFTVLPCWRSWYGTARVTQCVWFRPGEAVADPAPAAAFPAAVGGLGPGGQAAAQTRPCVGADRPAHDRPQRPGSPGGFPESLEGMSASLAAHERHGENVWPGQKPPTQKGRRSTTFRGVLAKTSRQT